VELDDAPPPVHDASMTPIVLIPARMAATRLPDKPLADIHGVPMIVHVWRRAVASGLGRVVVAAGEPAIADAVAAAGGEAMLTDPDLPSGSDRIAAALAAIDPGRRHDVVVNVQGDLPTLDPSIIRAAVDLLADPAVDIGTLGAVIRRDEERHESAIVKAVVELPPGARRGRALYFTRLTAPWGPGDHIHHIGLYAYRRTALERFVAAPPSTLERREKLEQLRALAMGMRIDVALVDTVPLGVDTQGELERARALLAQTAS
jgi:3-deoxy-manno-octulosonate cytidylyltransferase (CMP-KDO synthetase)